MEVLWIRHTSVGVPPGTCYGQSDVPVAATFAQEAAATRDALATYGPIDKAYTSPLTRARLLAAFCGYGDAEVDRRLLEMHMGEWEMQRYDDIGDPYLQQWYDDFLHLPTPHGESFTDQLRRVGDFIDDLHRHDYRRVAVFAHGGVLACAGICGGLYTLQTAWDHPTPYGGVIRTEIKLRSV